MNPRSLQLAERAGLGALVALTLIGFWLYPSYPNFDTVYPLVWADEILSGSSPSFEAFRAPTEHPASLGLALLLQPLGGGADRVMVALCLLSFVAVVAAVYRLGRDAFSPLVGLAAAALILSRFDFPFLAIRGYIDIPFMAAVLWAAVLELERPRRGGAVWVLLGLAGLMRPEAWLLLAAYWVWMVWPLLPRRTSQDVRPVAYSGTFDGVGWGDAVRWAAYAAAPVAVWTGLDWAVTGDPLFSLHSTSETVAELDRGEDLGDLPGALIGSANELLKPPVVLAGVAGLLLAAWFAPRRSYMPAIVLASGIATFLLIGAAGLAVIDRYLIVGAAGLCVFAGFAIGGFSVLERSRLRTAWALGAALVALAAVAFTATRTLQLGNFQADLAFRSDAHESLERALRSEPVAAALAAGCGPVSTPTHKLIPEVRWILGAPVEQVIARSDPAEEALTDSGVAVYAHTRRGLDLEGFDGDTSALTTVPRPGFERLATETHYTVWARCPA